MLHLSKRFPVGYQVNFSKINNVVEKLAEGVDNLFLGGFVDPQIRAVAGEPTEAFMATTG
jgi:hypothetical protein